MSDSVNYSEIHAYMLKKTREYYQNPPAELIDAVMEQQRKKGTPVTYAEARKLVSTIDIQRFVKREMTEKWPEFMASIPSNPLRSDER